MSSIGNPPRLVIASLFAVFLLAGASVKGQSVAPAASEGELAPAWTVERASGELTVVEERIGKLPAAPPEGSSDQRLRASLERRAALLTEYVQTAAQPDQLKEIRSGLPARKANAEKQIAQAEAAPPPRLPAAIDNTGFEKLRSELAIERDRAASLRKLASDLQTRRDRLPELIAATRERKEEAARRALQIESEADAGATEPDRQVHQLRLENARLDEAIAEKLSGVLQDEQTLARDREPVLSLEVESADSQLALLETRFELYGRALAVSMESDRQRTQEELDRLEKLAVEAGSAEERLLARWEADLVIARVNQADVQSWLIAMAQKITEQERRKASEVEEMSGLKELLTRVGGSAQVAERITLTLRQIKTRRQHLEQLIDREFVNQINRYRSRRITVESLLFDLADQWSEQWSGFPEAERRRIQATRPSLLSDYREALRNERSSLTEAIASGQSFQTVALDREESLDEMERFIRSKSFFIRDGLPLTQSALANIGREMALLAAWPRELASKSMRARLVDSVRGPTALLYGLLLFPVLPIVLYRTRQRLRGFVRKQNEKALDQGTQAKRQSLAVISGMLSAALIPIYLALASRFVAAAGFPPSVGPVLATTLSYAAWFFLFWFIGRSLFSGSAISEIQFGMRPELTRALNFSLRLVLLGYVSCLLVWAVTRQAPFQFVAIPRISYTLFLISAGAAVLYLFRPRSPLFSGTGSAAEKSFVERFGSLITGAVYLLVGAIFVLDVTGYRYAASRLLESFAWTLAVVGLLPLLNGTLAGFIGSASVSTDAPSGEITEAEIAARSSHASRMHHLQRLARVVCLVFAAYFLARVWGLNEHALQSLGEWDIYKVRTSAPEPEWVTGADLLWFFVYVVATIWLLRSLPGITEVAFLPRLKLDEGVKYAVLTMSRYGIFALGIVFALGALHLDLSRLGWLMAAVGVGLGFGLQEIVSNFVSGIILLVERPVQVGDSVTIGTISGKVTRINIRATTILNFDRQEVIVPNRSLITKEVTNWTRGDTINRLVIPIGVAYGTDVEGVSALLADIASEDPDVLGDPGPSVVFMRHGESSLDFELRVFIPSPALKTTILDRLNKAINRRFNERNITIPFPQRELHIRTENGKSVGDGSIRTEAPGKSAT